jgi:NAD(P)-dependent dehydrogenase (short-subunit alcohol dehydrogenase family)
LNSPAYRALFDLEGKVALVTGASRGIGASIARRFAEAGARVAVHYRGNADAAADVAASIKVNGGIAAVLSAELSDRKQVERLMDRVLDAFGALDIAVNNAGTFPTRPLLEIGDDEWRDMYRSNVDTAFLCTQAAAERMQGRGGGAIVNIGSIAGLSPGPDHSHYNSAKAAVLMLTRSAAQELGRYNIRVNAVSPGLIARPGIEQEWPDGVARWRASAPLERLGEPDDVADACLFLASPAARWITGHNLVVDGGVLSSKIW